MGCMNPPFNDVNQITQNHRLAFAQLQVEMLTEAEMEIIDAIEVAALKWTVHPSEFAYFVSRLDSHFLGMLDIPDGMA
jgi:hypothetical protein